MRLDEVYNGSQRKLLIQRKCEHYNLRTLQCDRCKEKWQEINIIVCVGQLIDTKLEYTFEGDGFEAIFVTVTMVEERHEIFKRHGHDLIMEMEIYLGEAITRFNKLIKALDNRTIILRKSSATRENDKIVLKEEGLPYYQGGNYRSGKLIIFCRIKYPSAEFFTPEKIRQLKEHLPPCPNKDITNAEECEMVGVVCSSAKINNKNF